MLGGRRIQRSCSARGEVRGVSCKPRWGATKHGADGPARRSSSVGQAWRMGPPPIPSPQTATGHNRMTRPSRRSPSRGAARGSWTRAWGQREPADQGTGRWRSPARWRGWLKGGLDIPSTHAGRHSLRGGHPIRTGTRRGESRAGRIRIFVFHTIAGSLNDDRLPVMHQPVDPGRGQGVVHIKQGAPFPEGRFVVSTIDPVS